MKYVPGPMFGQFSGSQGNTTAAHNPWGSYIRNRTTPTDPATSSQLVQRAAMATLSAAWRELSAGERTAWNALGGSIVKTDPLGQSYNLSGLQAFTSINRVRLTLGEALLAVAPTLDDPPDPTPLVLTGNSGISPALSLAFEDTPFSGTNAIMVSATPGVSAGINFQPRSRFKLIHVDEAAPTTPIDLLAAFIAIYGAKAPVGSKVFVSAVGVSVNRIAGPFITTSVVLGSS